MNTIFFSVLGFGMLAMGADAQPAANPSPAPIELSSAETGPPIARVSPPTDLEDDDSGDYMKHMTSAELETLYAEHDAEVARLMAAAPDETLIGEAFFIDPQTGDRVSIDLIAF